MERKHFLCVCQHFAAPDPNSYMGSRLSLSGKKYQYCLYLFQLSVSLMAELQNCFFLQKRSQSLFLAPLLLLILRATDHVISKCRTVDGIDNYFISGSKTGNIERKKRQPVNIRKCVPRDINMADDTNTNPFLCDDEDLIENELEDTVETRPNVAEQTELTLDSIAAKLLKDNLFLTALELHTELVEAGRELPRLRDYFSNPGNFERTKEDSPPSNLGRFN